MTSRFQLATLLKLRESVRDERRRHLAEALRADELAQAKLSEVELALSQLQQEFRATAGPLDVDRLLDAQRYELVLRFEQQVVQGKRAQVAEEIEKRRQALVVADRDVRALEILRERRLERARRAEQRAEARELDEVAGRRASGLQPDVPGIGDWPGIGRGEDLP
jgi:flagellar export protein FliJ